MTDRDDAVGRLLDRAAPEPPYVIDPAEIRAGMGPRPHIFFRISAPLLAAIAVLGVALAPILSSHGGRPRNGPAGPLATSPTQSPRSTFPPTPAGQKAAAIAEADRLLDTFKLPVGAHRVSDPPVKRLAEPGQPESSPALIDRGRIWVAPGSAQNALEYIASHLPVGISSTGRGGVSRYGVPQTQVDTYSFDPALDQPKVFTDAGVVVTAVQLVHGRGTGLRIDVQAIWLQPRSPAQTIPSTVTGVAVTLSRGVHAPTVRRVLGTGEARMLAAAVNRLTVSPQVTEVECGLISADSAQHRDVLVFSGPGPQRTVRSTTTGCTGTSVGPHVAGPALAGNVDAELLTLLGLPADYGR